MPTLIGGLKFFVRLGFLWLGQCCNPDVHWSVSVLDRLSHLTITIHCMRLPYVPFNKDELKRIKVWKLVCCIGCINVWKLYSLYWLFKVKFKTELKT